MKIGVLAIQGDVSEHISMLISTLGDMGISGTAFELRKPEQLDTIDALLIPGGESTAISKQMKRSGLWDGIISFAENGAPIMGTCAGCILLAHEVFGDDGLEYEETLAIMDITVKRNAFGRQKQSFERPLSIKGFEGEFPGIFIRAPAITNIGKDVEILAEIPESIVMARQNNILALTFHPELADDNRIHRYLLEMI
jgi:5'-phosphate synthase pdxT subunit